MGEVGTAHSLPHRRPASGHDQRVLSAGYRAHATHSLPYPRRPPAVLLNFDETLAVAITAFRAQVCGSSLGERLWLGGRELCPDFTDYRSDRGQVGGFLVEHRMEGSAIPGLVKVGRH